MILYRYANHICVCGMEAEEPLSKVMKGLTGGGRETKGAGWGQCLTHNLYMYDKFGKYVLKFKIVGHLSRSC